MTEETDTSVTCTCDHLTTFGYLVVSRFAYIRIYVLKELYVHVGL